MAGAVKSFKSSYKVEMGLMNYEGNEVEIIMFDDIFQYTLH